MTGLSDSPDEVAWYDKDLDDFDITITITIDRVSEGEELLDGDSGT